MVQNGNHLLSRENTPAVSPVRAGGRRRLEAADPDQYPAYAVKVGALVRAQAIRRSLQEKMAAFGNGSGRILFRIRQLAFRVRPIWLVRACYVGQVITVKHQRHPLRTVV